MGIGQILNTYYVSRSTLKKPDSPTETYSNFNYQPQINQLLFSKERGIIGQSFLKFVSQIVVKQYGGKE